MPYLTVDSIEVPVAWPDGSESPVEEVGDRVRAFAGNLLSSIRARASSWTIRTAPMDTGDAETLLAALIDSPPISCGGDLLGGTVSCDAEIHGKPIITIANNERRAVLSFTLHAIDAD